MPNFLNSAFKFLLRSFVITSVFLFAGLFSNAFGQAQITSFTTTKTEVRTSELFVLKWASIETSRCGIEISSNGSLIESRDGLPSTNSSGEDFTNRTPGDYVYTLVCASSLPTGPRSVERGINIKVSQASPIGTGGQCVASERVCTLCENYPTSGLCVLCSDDENSPTCQAFLSQCQEGRDSGNDSRECEYTTEQLGSLQTAAEDPGAIPEQEPVVCGYFPGTWGTCIIDWVYVFIDRIILGLFASFVQVSAYFFEFIINISIVQFSTLIGTGPDSWINNLWGLIRDILNIGVIFVLLYAAIQIIVGKGGEIKKLISGVILFGVLTNFSLFFTKAAVDLSNVIALEFYQQMRSERSIHVPSYEAGLGATITSLTGMTGFFTPIKGESPEATNKSLREKVGGSLLYRLAMIVIFIAISFMFLQAAGIFFVRLVTLILLLIFSPLMFAGAVFRPLKDWVSRWHKEFLGQVVLAPLFFITLYVAVLVLSFLVNPDPQNKGQLIQLLDEIKGDDGSYILDMVIITINTGLVIFIFFLALNQAKAWSNSIGGKAADLGGKLGAGIFNNTIGRASGTLLGGASALGARLGQNTLGRGSQWVMNKTGKDLPVLKTLANASFDARNSKTIQGAGSALSGGVSKVLSAASGGAVSGLKIDTSGALKQSDRFVGGYAKREDRKQKETDARLEAAIKKIDEDTKQYDIFDEKIVDSTGAELKRTTESDDDWEKAVNVANKYQKGQTLAKKNAYLAAEPILSKSTKEIKSQKERAQFRAVKAQQKKLSADTKKEKAHQDKVDRLKAYKDDLKTKFASDATSREAAPFDVDIGKTRAEIDAMTDEQIGDSWDIVHNAIQKELQKTTPDPGAGEPDLRRIWLDTQRKLVALASKAKNARQQMESLKKAIESHDQKK